MITVNIEKAKDIHREQIRRKRKPLLEALDVEFQRALETGADTSDIVQKKQELRDLTQHPDLLNAETAGQIREFWPEILNKR